MYGKMASHIDHFYVFSLVIVYDVHCTGENGERGSIEIVSQRNRTLNDALGILRVLFFMGLGKYSRVEGT